MKKNEGNSGGSGSDDGNNLPPISNSALFLMKNDSESNTGSESTSENTNKKMAADDETTSETKPIEATKPNLFSLSDESIDDIKSTIISFGFALLVRIFVFEPRYIPSLSMFPTFDVGDQLLVDKIGPLSRGYQRRDVVVFNPSQTYIDLTGNTEALIKRIVAVSGDSLEVKGNHVYVNSIRQEEPYIAEDPEYSLSETTVPPGMVLVLGDNRNKSYDSHIWGLLPEKNIIGRAVLKYWPPWRAGFVEGSN